MSRTEHFMAGARWIKEAPESAPNGWVDLKDTPLGHQGIAQRMDISREDRGHIFDGVAEARTRPVRLDSLVAGGRQTQVNRHQVEHYRTGGGPSDHPFALSPDAPVIVRDAKNQHHILDGHHRILGAIARGEPELPMKVYDANRKKFL